MLQNIGRRHTAQDIIDCFAAARAAGHKNINMDLIMGLPGEDLDDVNILRRDRSLKAGFTYRSFSLRSNVLQDLICFKEEYADLKISNTPEMIAFINECLKS